MFKTMTSAFTKGKTAMVAFTLALAGGILSFGGSALAVDPAVASTTGMVVDTMKENVTGVITANISNIVIVGVIIFSIGFVWKLTRRFMK